MLNVSKIAKAYPTRSGSLAVLNDCTFTLEPGKSLAVVGPSGSGKSTLLNILGTLEPPSAGSFELDGITPTSLSESEAAAFRRNKIGFIFQDHHLLPQCNALENVLIPFLADGVVTPSEKAYAVELLTQFGLGERLEHRPGELSGGERQRVAIARALVRRPSLLLADEPTGNLDRSTAATIADLFQQLLENAEKHATMLVLVTHDRQLAARMNDQKELDGGILRNL